MAVWSGVSRGVGENVVAVWSGDSRDVSRDYIGVFIFTGVTLHMSTACQDNCTCLYALSG